MPSPLSSLQLFLSVGTALEAICQRANATGREGQQLHPPSQDDWAHLGTFQTIGLLSAQV